MIALRESILREKLKVGIETHSQVLEAYDTSRKISEKEGFIAGSHSKVCDDTFGSHKYAVYADTLK